MTKRQITALGAAARCAAVCAMWLAIFGCRETPTTVKGLVTLDGRPLAMRDGKRGTVVFQPTTSSGTTLSGIIDGHGRYELSAGSSNVVTSSVYWATVSAVEIVPPDDEHPQPTGRRITPAKYASAADSGFRVEVVPGENVIDLALSSEAEPAVVATPADAKPATANGDAPLPESADSREIAPPEGVEVPESAQQRGLL